MLSLLLKTFLSLIIVGNLLAALQPTPPLAKIEVIEDQEYDFGLIETDYSTNITKCSYTTDKPDIHGEFQINKYTPPKPKKYNNTFPSIKNEKNQISDWGQMRQCRIFVKNVDDSGPRRWTLTPTNQLTESKVEILPSVNFEVRFFYKIPLLQDTVSVYEEDSFYQYMNDSTVTFKTCQLRYKDTIINLDVNKADNNNTKGKPLSLGNGLCGFKIAEVTKESAHEWTIDGIDVNNKPYRAVFKIYVRDKLDPKTLYKKVPVLMGDTAYITCGNEYNQLYCFLYDPKDNLVYTTKRNCEYSITTASMDILGNWTCVVGTESPVHNVNYTVELVFQAERTVVGWVNESETHVSIGCQLRNTRNTEMKYCKLIAPNHQIFVPKVGFTNGRYFAFGTNYKQGACGIEIPKPLLDYENGIWLCEIRGVYHTGRFLSVGKAVQPTYKKHFRITRQIGDNLPIVCEVPFSSPYCHIREPNGTIHINQNNEDSSLGRCILETTANFTHNGTWTCSFARDVGMPDEVIYVEVTIAEVLLSHSNEQVDSGSSASLLCSTGGLPLKYCRFVAPYSEGFYVTNDLNTSSMVYYGKGLEYGDCGIKLLKTQSADSGYWTCFTSIGSSNREYELSAQIDLEVKASVLEDPNIVMAVSIAAGVVVVTVLVSMVGFRIWKRRRNHVPVGGEDDSRPRRSQRRNDPDNDSENVDIFSMTTTPRSYTNPQAVRDDDHAHQL